MKFPALEMRGGQTRVTMHGTLTMFSQWSRPRLCWRSKCFYCNMRAVYSGFNILFYFSKEAMGLHIYNDKVSFGVVALRLRKKTYVISCNIYGSTIVSRDELREGPLKSNWFPFSRKIRHGTKTWCLSCSLKKWWYRSARIQAASKAMHSWWFSASNEPYDQLSPRTRIDQTWAMEPFKQRPTADRGINDTW